MAKLDLTEGNITKQLIQIASPLVIGNILQQMYNMVDALMIGRFATGEEFAAIGVAGTILNLFLFIIIGACNGISVLFAQLYGQKNDSEIRREHFEALVLGTVGTIIIMSIGFVFTKPMLLMMHTPENITHYVVRYLRIVFAGVPFAFVYNFYGSFLRAIGNTKVPVWALFGATIVNVILDLWFVKILQLGIIGAAAATIIAQLVSACVCLVFLWKKMPELRFQKSDCKMNAHLMRRTIQYSFATALHQSGLYIGKILIQGIVNTGGVSMIMAYTATTRIEGFVNSFGDSGCAATSVIVAQNYGAKNEKRVRYTYKKSKILLFVFGIVCSVILYLTADVTSSFMLNAKSGMAYENAVQYLHIVALFYIFCYTGNTFAGYFNGVGMVTIPMIGAVGHITIRVILSWMWISAAGLNAVAFATGIGWMNANVFWQILYWKSQKKKRTDIK